MDRIETLVIFCISFYIVGKQSFRIFFKYTNLLHDKIQIYYPLQFAETVQKGKYSRENISEYNKLLVLV
jgi:hypothetical protein